jgi:alginate O-acetyltransferase complex protein AlgJ
MPAPVTDSGISPQMLAPTEDLQRSPIRTLARRLFAAAFTLFMAIVFVGTWLHWDPVKSRENRNLAKMPPLPKTYAQVKTFSDQLMVFYRDHFGFRNALIRAVALGKYHGLGPEINDRIIVGKDGWLFYASDEKFLADRGLDPFSQHDLESWQSLLERRQKWFGDRGIPLVIVIPPDKQSIYPEFMPEEFSGFSRPTRLDQLIDFLRERHSPVHILDLRPALLDTKKQRQIYFKTDSHWNDYGAYVGYRTIMVAIQQALPTRKITPLTLDDFVAKTITKSGDLAQQVDLYFEYQEQTAELIRRDLLDDPRKFEELPKVVYTTWPDPAAPRLLTFNDSFTGQLIQFFQPNFSLAAFNWNPITETIDPKPVEQWKPDVVISEFVERKLHDPIPVDPAEIR